MRTGTHAPRALLGFTVAVTRAVAVLALLGALSAAYLVALGENDRHQRVPDAGTSAGAPIWKESYSRRFPGCVAVLLWPPSEQPRALLVRSPSGGLAKVPLREAVVRMRSVAAEARLVTVGVCR